VKASCRHRSGVNLIKRNQEVSEASNVAARLLWPWTIKSLKKNDLKTMIMLTGTSF